MVLLTGVVSLHSTEDALEELGGPHTLAVEHFMPSWVDRSACFKTFY